MMSEQLEALAAELHEVYEVEINRQGRVSGHPAHYSNLSEQVKDLDRALARFILNRDRDIAEELRAPGPCGKHPKACWVRRVVTCMPSQHQVEIDGYCTACSEIAAAVSKMRELAAQTAHNEKNGDNRVIEERILALPLSAPPEAGGEK